MGKAHSIHVGTYSESPSDRLWKEYSSVFSGFDDLTLARWMCQTLGQLAGKSWRLSHPLIGAYRLAAQLGHDRQIWFKRMATPPADYLEAGCCRSPLLPLLTRDVLETGLTCQHCGETAIAFEDAERKQAGNYDGKFEEAAQKAERLLAQAATRIVPKLLEEYSAIVWEDQDECLEVRPEDIDLT